MGCTTISGPDPYKSCVFPFYYHGKNRKCCTTVQNDPGNETAWCSTLVDDLGVHVVGKWGVCEPKCQQRIDGKLLFFNISGLPCVQTSIKEAILIRI